MAANAMSVKTVKRINRNILKIRPGMLQYFNGIGLKKITVKV